MTNTTNTRRITRAEAEANFSLVEADRNGPRAGPIPAETFEDELEWLRICEAHKNRRMTRGERIKLAVVCACALLLTVGLTLYLWGGVTPR